MSLNNIVKPKTQRAKRELAKREPKIHENDKKAMLIKGGHTSEKVTQTLKDLPHVKDIIEGSEYQTYKQWCSAMLNQDKECDMAGVTALCILTGYAMKKPEAVLFQRRNIMRPFEDQTSLEFFSNKNDASLFLFGSHSKKRPHNLVFGRLYDHHILDIIELGIDDFKPMSEFKCAKIGQGNKPCIMFAGEEFEQDLEHQRLKSLLIDFFRGPVVENIRLQGLEHVYMFTANKGKVYLRSYRISLKKSGSRTPRVELELMGPSLDLSLRRTKLASDDLYKRALRQPKTAKPKKKKNITHDAFGTKEGRIHMEKQDLSKLQLRKIKGLKRTSSEATKSPSKKKLKASDET